MSEGLCPACGAAKTGDFKSKGFCCASCGLVWMREQRFGAPVYDERMEQDIYESGKDALFKRCLGFLARQFPSGGKLLDVGSAYGAFLGSAKSAGWSAEGIEINPKMAAAASAAGFKVYGRPIEELRLPDASYDAVTVFEVFCLMSDPFKAAAEMHRALKPGGTLYIREFNGAFHTALDRRRIFNILGLRPTVIHNFNFTGESVRRMLTAAGFRDIKIENSPPTAGDPYGTGGFLGGFLTGLLKYLYYYMSQVIYIASFGGVYAGSSFIVTARK